MLMCNWMGYWLCRLFAGIGVGRRIVSYWPKEGRYVVVEVSSVKFMTFTAKFPDGEPDFVDPWSYGQLDNDVEYDRRTRTPVYKPNFGRVIGR